MARQRRTGPAEAPHRRAEQVVLPADALRARRSAQQASCKAAPRTSAAPKSESLSLSIYLFQVASQKAQWLSARQTAVASNVANANTPGYRALDVEPFSALLDTSPMAMATTNPGHMAPASSTFDALREVEADPAEETLSGNSVNIEQQMINLGAVGRDFSMTANIRRAFHQLMLSALK